MWVGVWVGVDVGVSVSVGVTVGVSVAVGVAVGISVSVGVGDGVSVPVGVKVGVSVGLGVKVGVSVGVGDGVSVGVSVGVGFGLQSYVGDALLRGVGVLATKSALLLSESWQPFCRRIAAFVLLSPAAGDPSYSLAELLYPTLSMISPVFVISFTLPSDKFMFTEVLVTSAVGSGLPLPAAFPASCTNK